MRAFTIIILLTLIYGKVKGQDIVYLKNGATLGGLITMRGEEHIRFKSSITNKGERIENDRIERYYLGKQKSYYYLKEIPEKYLHYGASAREYFVKQVVAGKINIYLFSYDGLDIPVPSGAPATQKYLNPYANKVKQYFIEKDNTGMKPVNFELLVSADAKKETEEGVAELLSDNPALADKFRADKKTIKKIIAYAREYNEWYKNK